MNRDYHEWKTSRIVIDTTEKSIEVSIQELMKALVN
jgi:hypothetical protein